MKNKITVNISALFLFALFTFTSAFAQSATGIKLRCPAPNTNIYGQIQIIALGDIRYTPCPSRSSIFTGNVNFSGATIIGLFPVTTKGDLFTFSTVPARLGVGVNGQVLSANSATATGLEWTTFVPANVSLANGSAASPSLNFVNSTTTGIYRPSNNQIGFSIAGTYAASLSGSGFTLVNPLRASDGSAATPSLLFTTSPSTGFYLSAADVIGVSTAGVLNSSFSAATNTFTSPIQTFTSSTSDNHNTALFNINNAAGNAEFKATFTTGAAGLGSFVLGDNTGGAGASLSVTNSTDTFDFDSKGSTGVFDLDSILNYQTLRTVTAAGTTGNQTINKPFGTVNIAAAGTFAVVTNSVALSTSLIFCTVQNSDTTAISCRVTNKANGSFRITIPAATAETSIAFWVTN